MGKFLIGFVIGGIAGYHLMEYQLYSFLKELRNERPYEHCPYDKYYRR